MEMRILTAENQLPGAVDHMNSSNSSTPYMSAASSPRRPRSQLDFFFYSAPTSPRSYNHSMAADLYDDYSAEDVALLKHDHSAAVPFDWELKPGVAKGICNNEGDDQQQKKMQVLENEKEEFEFDFSGQLDRMVRPSLSSADELFDRGKIRPLKLKPPPSLQINNNNNDSRINSENHSPRSPKSAMSKFKDALSVSPRHRRKGSDEDPFEAAIHSSRKSDSAAAAAAVAAVNDNNSVQDRGRSKFKTTANTNTNKRGSNNNRKGISRSLSPLRVSEFALLHHQQLQEHQNNSNENSSNNSCRFLGRGTNTSSKKWSLKDLFLFRSASEGHYKDTQSFSKRWSAKSSTTVSPGSGSGSGSKRRGQGASAHEMHYTTNKAVSEEMKKKTSLPYKHGLLACLGFSPILPQFSYAFPSSSSTTLS